MLQTEVYSGAYCAGKILAMKESIWWKAGRTVSCVDPSNNGKHLLAPLSESA